MAFLRNRSVNFINAHYGLLSLAARSGGVFVAVFMLDAGVPPAAVLAAYACIYLTRFCIRPLVLVAAKAVGIRPIVMFGALFLALQYPLLANVKGVDLWLLGVVVVAAVSDACYWTGYHAFFASHGDSEHRGHQISAREAMVATIGIVAPILGGWTLTTFGPHFAFGVTSIIQAVSILPLFGAPNVPVARQVDGAFQASLPGFQLTIADGWATASSFMLWQLVLFGFLDHSFTTFGGAMAAAALAGAVFGLLLGRSIDRGHGSRAVWLAVGSVIGLILARSATGGMAMAVTVNAASAIVAAIYAPTLMTAIYNLSKGSPCPFRFQMATESGFDIGCGLGCLTAAVLIAIGLPMQVVILQALLGSCAVLYFLRRYYQAPRLDGAGSATS